MGPSAPSDKLPGMKKPASVRHEVPSKASKAEAKEKGAKKRERRQ